jgi:hypothetical protein
MTTTRPSAVLRRAAALLGDDGLFGQSLAIVVLVAVWVATWRPQVDPDFGWHLRIGEGILDGRGIPHTDIFSWLTAGQPFVAHSWAWDVVLAAAYRSAGLMGTSLVGLPLSALAIGLLWWLIGIVGPTIPPLGRSLLVAVGIVAGLPVWSARAQIWDLVLILACVALWTLWLRRGSIRALALVPVVPLLWVNLHGGGTIAFFACLVALVVAIPIGTRWAVWSRPRLTPLFLSTAAAILLMGLNPYGFGILSVALDGVIGFQPLIAEWQAPPFGDIGFLTLRVLIAFVALVAFALRGRRRDPFYLLLAAGWTFLTLGGARFVIIAGPLLVLALAPAVGGAIDSWLGIHLLDRRAAASPSDTVSRPPRTIALATTALSILVLVIGIGRILPASQDAAIEAAFPVTAVRAMNDAQCHGRILNAYDWGGFLIASWTDPVATYGSSPNEAIKIESQLERLEIDPRPFLESNGVDLVLMPTGGPLDRWLDAVTGWSVVHSDSKATLRQRTGSNVCQTLAIRRQIFEDQ